MTDQRGDAEKAFDTQQGEKTLKEHAKEQLAELKKSHLEALKDEVVEPGLQLPPQVKFGIAIMELEDGSVVRMPISPSGQNITYGQMMRMLMGELEDMRAEMLALKVRKLLGGPPPQAGGEDSLVDRS